MANNRRGVSLRSIHSLFTTGTVVGLADGHLLQRIATGDGEAAGLAFAALVERHGPMVLRVCRGVLRDIHDAEDAFQATFLILARKAGSIRSGDSLASWLYGVAYNVASTARSAAARRRFHESKAGATRPQTLTQGVPDDLGPVVHEELGRLPERYRAAVVLCCLEGLTQQQAAQQLGWPLGTVQSRLARGRERLRIRLARRGVAPALGVASVTDLGKAASAKMPEGLANSVIVAVMRLSEGREGAELVSAPVSDLITRASRALLMYRLKVAATMIIAAGAMAGVATLAQEGAKVLEKSFPAPVAARPGNTEPPGRGVIAIPGPPPGRKTSLIFAVIGKLSNGLTLEPEDQGRIRASLSRGEGGKINRVFQGVSIKIDASRQAPVGPESIGDPVVETTEDGDVVVFPGPRPGEPMQLEASLMGMGHQRLVITSEVGNRFRVRFLDEDGFPPSGDVLCSAIRFDALHAAE